jgi:radical SAM protein with 4Fe4S-binding SPASM domain
MSLEVAQKAISEVMEAEDEFDGVEFDLFGGEPLLAFERMRQIVEWFHSRTWPKKHLFFCGTNGTILDDEIKGWLLSHRCVKVGVSLDGNKVAHDLNRSGSYDQVMRNLPFFLKHWPEQPVKMTINAESIPHVADSVIELEEKGLLFSANVAFENFWGGPDQKEQLLAIYSEQLERLVEYYVEHPSLYPVKVLGHQFEHASMAKGAGRPAGDCVRWCGAGHEMTVVNVDGTRAPCHRFAPWISGRPAPTQPINRQASWKPDRCGACRIVDICPVCAGYNWQENGDTGVRTDYHCEAFKLEVLASAKLEALRLLRRSPKEVVEADPERSHTSRNRLDAILEFVSTGV